MKAKKRNYTLHWKLMEPYNFFIVVATGPDREGIRRELRRSFKVKRGSKEPPLDAFFVGPERDYGPNNYPDGLCIFLDGTDNIVIYIKKLYPDLPTLVHELYHAVRKAARSFGFEGGVDEAEAHLFQCAFEYFTRKIKEDCRAMTGAEQDKGGRK